MGFDLGIGEAALLAGATGAAEGGGTFAELGTIASIGSSLIGGVGSLISGNAKSESAKYNAAVAANNATIASQNATRAAQAGEAQAAMSQQKTRATVGAIKASQAASGIDVNQGSAVDVRSSAAELGELDAITIRSNAARTAYGYQTQSASDTAQSNLDKFTAENDETASEIGAGTTVLGGLGSASLNYGKFLNNGGMSAS